MNILLSICIPTYNRANVLRESLYSIGKQINEYNREKIEIFVSDNCSPDNTQEVVDEFICKNLPITYNRNECNLGPDGNFLYCFRHARGKYIWLLGDDDFLIDDSLDYLINIMFKQDNGLIHLDLTNKLKQDLIYYKDTQKFLKRVSYMSTFMSVNILNSSNIKNVDNPDQYLKSFFLQIPFYINAAVNPDIDNNIIIHKKMLNTGYASSTNGGFNFFEVSLTHFLTIWDKAVDYKWIDKSLFSAVKKDLCLNWIIPKIHQYLIMHQLDANYDLTNSWHKIFAEYKYKIYFYYGICFFYIKKMIKKILSLFFKKYKNDKYYISEDIQKS